MECSPSRTTRSTKAWQPVTRELTVAFVAKQSGGGDRRDRGVANAVARRRPRTRTDAIADDVRRCSARSGLSISDRRDSCPAKAGVFVAAELLSCSA